MSIIPAGEADTPDKMFLGNCFITNLMLTALLLSNASDISKAHEVLKKRRN